MGNKRIDPRQQFSKKLASRVAWFWFFYMILLVALIAYRPEAAMVTVYLAIIVSVIMAASNYQYTKNSIWEKCLLTAQDMAKIKFSWKHKGLEMVTPESIVDNDEEEGDDNG